MPLHTPEYKKFLEILVRARVEKNVTQIELSKRLGKTQQFVSRCEVGERRLDVIEFYDWCEALGVDGESMFSALGAWLRTTKMDQLI
jgi:transcriptional regulator with XRE-family HTH domain